MRKILMLVLLAFIISAQGAMAAKATLECDWYTRATGTMIAYGYYSCQEAMGNLAMTTWNAADSNCQSLGFDTFCPSSSEVVGSCYWNGTTGTFQANGERTYVCGDVVPQ